jgi:hypothetical protein
VALSRLVLRGLVDWVVAAINPHMRPYGVVCQSTFVGVQGIEYLPTPPLHFHIAPPPQYSTGTRCGVKCRFKISMHFPTAML